MKTNPIKLFFIALLSISVLTGCLKDNDEINNIPRATLILVNSYSPSPYISQMADNNYLTSPYTPLEYNKFIGHPPKYLFTGNRKIKTISSDNRTLIDTLYTFKDSSSYTSFVYGTADKPQQIITDDKVVDKLGDKSAIRFLHLANNTAKVNVYLKDLNNVIVSGRAFETQLIGENLKHAEFIAQNSGAQKVIITDENNTILKEREYNFEKGRYYTILLSGDKESTEKPLYLGIVAQY